jgi:hypothetical protein
MSVSCVEADEADRIQWTNRNVIHVPEGQFSWGVSSVCDDDRVALIRRALIPSIQHQHQQQQQQREPGGTSTSFRSSRPDCRLPPHQYELY